MARKGHGIRSLAIATMSRNVPQCESNSGHTRNVRRLFSRGKMNEKPSASSPGSRLSRCGWARNELAILYHDKEWGTPVHDDRALFEFLILEGAQAGLSWDTILRKRDNYRAAFDRFDVRKIAKYGAREKATLLKNAGIIRNRLKIDAAVANAQATLAVQKEFGSLDAYLWQFVGGRPKRNGWRNHRDLPASTAESDAMSKDLRKRGFSFVGTTICYALMQATGMVNDHLVTCFRYKQV